MQEGMEGLPEHKHGKVNEEEKDFIYTEYSIMRCNIKKWRKELGLTRYEFAQKCNIGVASVAGIEEGKIIQHTRILRIRYYLGKTNEELYDDTAYKEELLRNASRLQKEMERLGFNPDEKFEEIKQAHAKDKEALKIKRQETLAQLEMKDNEINRASK
jgi:transcriptional regulator with XRE-family HTH domain